MNKRRITTVAILVTMGLAGLVLAAMTYGPLKNPAVAGTAPGAPAAGAPTTVEAKPGSVSVKVEGPSVVEAFVVQTIRAPIEGVIAISPTAGQAFTAGQVLLQLDKKDAASAVEQANLNHRQALINLDKAKTASENAARDRAKKQTLLAVGAVTQEQVDTAADAVVAAGYALKSAELSVDQAAVALSRSRDDLAATDIRAPYAGVVLACDLYPGDMVNKGAPLATFADLSRVRLWAEVDEYDIGKVKEGQEVSITADALGKDSLASRVERVSPAALVVNNISIFKVSAVLASGDGRLKPGMSADVAILIKSDKGIVVPSTAVETIRSRGYVKVLEGGEVKTKRVTAGADDGTNVAILEGLAEGERVVVSTPRPSSASPATAQASASGSTVMPVTVPGVGKVGASK